MSGRLSGILTLLLCKLKIIRKSIIVVSVERIVVVRTPIVHSLVEKDPEVYFFRPSNRTSSMSYTPYCRFPKRLSKIWYRISGKNCHFLSEQEGEVGVLVVRVKTCYIVNWLSFMSSKIFLKGFEVGVFI